MSNLLTFVPDEWRQITFWWIVICCFIALGYFTHRFDPRYKEREVARKKEREHLGQLLSDALQDARRIGKITPKIERKYNIYIGKALGLPDMVPMSPTARYWSSRMADLNKAKQACIRRLTAMGVNIADGLERVRKGRNKKTRLRTHSK